MDNFLKINNRVYPSIWDLRVYRLTKLQNSDFQSHFSLSKIVRIFLFFSSLKNINLRHQFLLKTFFDKFNFKNILFLKLGRKIVNFLNLSTPFRCNFCDSTSTTFIVISFHQIPLTWWNAFTELHFYVFGGYANYFADKVKAVKGIYKNEKMKEDWNYVGAMSYSSSNPLVLPYMNKVIMK